MQSATTSHQPIWLLRRRGFGSGGHLPNPGRLSATVIQQVSAPRHHRLQNGVRLVLVSAAIVMVSGCGVFSKRTTSKHTVAAIGKEMSKGDALAMANDGLYSVAGHWTISNPFFGGESTWATITGITFVPDGCRLQLSIGHQTISMADVQTIRNQYTEVTERTFRTGAMDVASRDVVSITAGHEFETFWKRGPARVRLVVRKAGKHVAIDLYPRVGQENRYVAAMQRLFPEAVPWARGENGGTSTVSPIESKPEPASGDTDVLNRLKERRQQEVGK